MRNAEDDGRVYLTFPPYSSHGARNVVLFSVLVYELVGPTLTRMALTAAGEIRPEGRTSARVENKPKEPVSVQG